MVLYRSPRHSDNTDSRRAIADANNRVHATYGVDTADIHSNEADAASADTIACSRRYGAKLRALPPPAARRVLLGDGYWSRHFSGVSAFISIFFPTLSFACAVAKLILTFAYSEFYEWNPAVGNDCQNLWPDYYYCVGL